MAGLWAPRDWLRDIDSEDFQQSADQIIGTVMPAIDAAKSQATDAIQSTAQAGAQAYQQAATNLPKFTIPSLSSLTSGWGNDTSQPSTATDQLDTTSTGVEAPTTSSQPAASPLSRFTIPNLTSLLSGWEAPKPPETVEFTPSAAEGPAPSGAATVSAPGMPTATPSGQPAAPVALPDRLDTSSRDANLRQWAPALQDTERRTGLRADALAAIIQAENGGGQSPLSANDNNYFSISYVGRPMQAGPGTGGRFARYATPQDSLNDFVDLIQKHYPEAWANRSDPAKFFAGLVKGGYIVEEPGFPVSTWMNNLETGRQHFAAIAPAPAQAGPTAQAAAAPPAPGSQVDDVAQSALDDPDKWALCGPVAAVIAAQTRGQGWTVADAKRIAQAGNLWDASTGMHGLESQVTLLNRMSINAKTGPADQGRLAADAQAGNTPIISTNKHYFVLKGYDPQTGRFDTTTTGTALKGGSRWLTLDQISTMGNGIQGAAYIDNPASPTPSVVASSGTSGTASTSTTAMAASRTSAEAPQPTFYRQPLQPTPGADTTPIEDASSPPGASVPGAPPWEQNPSTAPGVGIPPVRDDYATAGSSVPAAVPSAQAIPQEDPTAIPRPAYIPPAMPLVTAPEPSPAPPPPSVSGPRFNPLAGQTQPPQPGELPPRNAPPPSAPLLSQPAPTPASSTAPYNPLANQPPAQPGELPAHPGVVEPTPVTEVGAVGAYTRGNAPPPAAPDVVQAVNRGETVNPFHWANQVSDAAADQVVRSVGIDPESAQGVASKFVVSAVVNPINWEGGAFSATAEAAARAGLPFLRAALPAIAERFGAETAGRVSTWLASQGSELAANVAGQAAAGAVTNPEAPGFGAAFGGGTAAVLGPAGRVIGRGVGAVGSELRAGAERAATVEAEQAGQAGIRAPGVFGVAPPEAGPAAEAIARPRFVPPDVRAGLGTPREIPDDPRFAQAVENVGGQITDRGIELHVTRAQGETAAGQTATRGGVFVEPVREGGRSSYVTSADNPNAVGGAVVLPPTKTLYRKPLVIDEAPGGMRGFNRAAEQLGVMTQPDPAEIERLQANIRKARADADMNRRYGSAPVALEQERAAQQMEQDLAALQHPGPLLSADIDQGIRAARAAGPEGSPARAAALKDLVSRYGGDPSLIDPLLRIRGADASESAWAIKENIVASNARKQGYDGVFTMEDTGEPNWKAINQHPLVVKANDDLSAARDALNEAAAAHQTAPTAANWRAYQQAEQAAQAAADAYKVAQQEAERLVGTAKLTEILDVQQGRNPTPGTHPSVIEAQQAVEAAQQRYNDLSRTPMAQRTPEQLQALREANDVVYSTRDRLRQAQQQYPPGQPGYSLHPDVAARADAQKTARQLYDDYQAAREVWRTSLTEAAGNAAEAEMQRLSRLMQEKVRAGDTSLTGVPASGDSTTAAGTAGITPVPVRQHTDVLASVNRALGQGVASAVSGGVGAATNQQLNPDDPNAALKGFAVGAVAPFALSRGARGLARVAGREAGRTEGALATLGGLPGEPSMAESIQARRHAAAAANNVLEAAGVQSGARPNPVIDRVEQEAARRAKQGRTSPNLLEISQNIRYSVGMLGNPATGILNAAAGPAETGLGVATAAIRTGILEGRPAPVVYMTAELAKGMAEGVINALGTAAGIIPKAVREAPDFRVPLNERMTSPVGRAVGFAIETPGRITTQAPDALFQRGFWRAGRVREAAAMLDEAGDISRFRPDQQVAEIHRLLTNPTPEEAQRIDAGARQFAQELGYRLKADPVQRKLGGLFRHGDRPATSEDSWVAQAHDFVGSHVMPFFSSIYQINKRGLTLVPGVGSVVGHDLPVKEQLARQMVGASLIYFANDYAAKGGITGPGPSDPDKLALLRNQGWEPSSTYVPGVGYVPNLAFGSAAPILNGLGAYHDSQRYATTAEQADPQKFNERIVKDQGRVWAQFPVMQGMASLYTMATQPVKGTTDFLAGAASSYVPAAWKASEVAQDPYNRTTDRQGPFAEQLRQKVIARSGYIPGLGSRQDLPVAQDRFGRPVENPRQGIGAILPRIQQQKDDPAAQLFAENGVDVGLPPTEVHVTTYSGTSKQGTSTPVPLTPDEQRQWNTLRGQILLGAVNGLTERTAWQRATPEARQKFLQQQVELSNEAAKQQVLRQIGTAEVRRRMATPAIQAAS